MKASYHVVVSAGVSAGFYAATHSWPATIGCFLSGVLIDVDHYFDYCLVMKKFPFRYKDLVHFCLHNKDSKLYLPFHAYEFLFALWISIFIFHLNLIWFGVAVGLTVHLAFDQFTNPIKPLFYFITFRIMNNFEKRKTVSEAYFQRSEE